MAPLLNCCTGSVALLVAVQFALAYIFHDMPLGLEKIKIIGIHKSIGMTLLALAVLRLLWRLANPVPPLPDTP